MIARFAERTFLPSDVPGCTSWVEVGEDGVVRDRLLEETGVRSCGYIRMKLPGVFLMFDGAVSAENRKRLDLYLESSGF